MGFSPREMTFSEERKHKGKVAVDPNRWFNSLYDYCDAAEAIPVGDIKAPLLRVVRIGSVLWCLFRRALLFLKSGAKILGKQALNVAIYMIDAKSFKESAKDRLKEGIKTFASQRKPFNSLAAE